jgi:protein-export membrane protein SecD
MKRCQTCTRVYDDDNLKFCLDDGTPLIDRVAEEAAPATLVLPESQQPAPTIKQEFRADVPPINATPPNSGGGVRQERNVLLWVGVVAVLLLFGAGVAVGAFVIYFKSQPLVWHLTLEVEAGAPDRDASARQAARVIETRLDAFGVSGFRVAPQGNGRITVDLPALEDPERIKQLITSGGKLELSHVVSPPSPAAAATYATKEEAIASLNSDGNVPANRRVLAYEERENSDSTTQSRWVVVEVPAIVDGSDLRTASAAPSYGDEENYQINFSLRPNGAEKFGTWTGSNINEYLGVILNDQVKSIAYIRGQINDQGEITGRFTKQSAEDLALTLNSGALPAAIKIVEERVDK